MKLHFYVRFHTNFGQTLSVLGNIPVLGQDKPADAILMQYFNNDYWQLSIDIDPAEAARIHYKYVLTYADGFQVIEWGDDREVDISKTGIDEIQLVDTWNYSGEYENVFFTAPFHETLLKPNHTP